jgi:predicted Zn-dependent peptidase
VLGCLLFGESSALSHKLYREGTISSTLSFESTMNRSFGHLIVFANTDYPEETLAALKEALYSFTAPDPTDFLACKRMELGDLFQSLDSTEEYASDYLAHRMEGSNLFAYADALSALTPDDVTDLARRLQAPNLTAEALVLPKSRKE